MSQESSNSLVPGSMFGAYRVSRTLGEGAFGAVYEAFRIPLNKRVALKVLHREMASNPNVVQRFLREAELVAQIEHPNIVDVLDVGVASGVPFLAMEFLEGSDLSGALKNGPLPVPVALDYLLPILSAVSTVHAHGIVHRDLKPENIFLARSTVGGMVPKLLDFGIAKVQQAEHSLTRTNSLMGTPFYMSPEQARESKNIDAQSDQWALAVIVYECVTGRRVFNGSSLLEILSAIAAGPITPGRSLNPAIPQEFDAVVLRALSRPTSERYPSVREFALALLPFASPATQDRWAPIFAHESAPPTAPLQLNTSSQTPPTAPPAPAAVTVINAPRPAETLLSGPNSLAPALPGMNANTLEPTAHPLSQGPAPAASTSRGPATTFAAAGVVFVALLSGGAFVKLRPEARPSRTPTATPIPTVAIALRVEPASATIQFDSESPVVGSLTRRVPRNGSSHSLRVSAEGFETQTLAFRDEPPPEQIVLRAVQAPVAQPLQPPAVPPTVAPLAPPAVAPPVVAHADPPSDPGALPGRRRHAGPTPPPSTPEPPPGGRIRAE